MADRTRVESAAPTRVEGKAAGKTRIEPPVGGASWLPPSLSARYELVQAFPAAGAQAELYLVNARQGGEPYVLKIYRRGLQPKAEVLEALRGCDPKHVVRLYESGEADGVWFEVLEYGKHGSLRDLLSAAPFTKPQALEVLREIAVALSHIHSRNIIHRDLKPENVLVRSLKPLDLILTDFGIASVSEATQHFTTTSRTVKYGAPEAAAGVVNASSDFWALGLILVEALTGRHPFDGLSDLVIFQQILTSTVDVSGVSDSRWNLLCRGLLTRNHAKRWGAKEVSSWLNGEVPPAFFEEGERPSQRPYRIAKQQCITATELAVGLSAHWKEGVRDLARGLIVPWLRDDLRDQEACNLLVDLTEDRSLSNDERLLRFIAGVGRGLPPTWKGLSLDPESLAGLCRDNISDAPTHPGFIKELFERKVLGVWARAGNEEAGTIQKLWEDGLSEFRLLWTKIRSAGAPIDKEPDEKVLSPTLLLTVVSPEFRQALKDEMASTAAQSMRCDWYAALRGSAGPGALVIKRRVCDVAMREGEEEIKAAQQLSGEIKSLISDFGEVLAADPEYHAAINALRQAVGANVARKSRELSVSVRQSLFGKAKETLATSQLKRLRKRWTLEILIDGAIFASLFTLARYVIGEVMSGDGFAYVWPLLAQWDTAGALSLATIGVLAIVTVLSLIGEVAPFV